MSRLLRIENDFIYDSKYPEPDGFGKYITLLFKRFAKVNLLFTFLIHESYDRLYGFKYNDNYYEFMMINREDFIAIKDDGIEYYIMTVDNLIRILDNICHLINIPLMEKDNELMYYIERY